MERKMKNLLVLITTIHICFGSAFAQKQKPLASVPFELVREKIFMKARVNGSEEINLQFDTGAGSASIDDTTAEKLKLVASGETKTKARQARPPFQSPQTTPSR